MPYDEWKRQYIDNTRESVIMKSAGDNKIRGAVHVKPKFMDISNYGFDSNHANEIRRHNVTKEDAERYVDNALVSITRYYGKYECFFSSEGAAYVNVEEKNIRTAFKRNEFDERTAKFIEEVENIE